MLPEFIIIQPSDSPEPQIDLPHPPQICVLDWCRLGNSLRMNSPDKIRAQQPVLQAISALVFRL